MTKNQLAKIYSQVEELRKEQGKLNERYQQCEKDIISLALNNQLSDIPVLVEEMKSNRNRWLVIYESINFRWRKLRESGHDRSEAWDAHRESERKRLYG